MHDRVKHIDLKEIGGRLVSNRPVSARGKSYVQTELGQADLAFMLVVVVLKSIWTESPEKVIRISDIEANKEISHYQAGPRIAASVKRLARMKQLLLDFDNEGVLIKKGSAWIETPPQIT